ncbi:NUDIX hydrolase [Patulibacter sp.]|uniref:NUDIX hydrolase n=1 Tax=Patulibacter sp. TaxID=1912859 RepID=UPI002717287C|nr:NUDIX hydrolase [Patulibacter sp.]MDO9407671.1 NUDIX hydrolase [Patulibacter sp.]
MSTPPDRRFERTGGTTLHDGRVVHLVEDTFRYADGAEVRREIIRTTGSVGMLVHDGSDLLLTRQPREAIGRSDSLEIPAGRLDRPGEDPADCARRELTEEVGFAAASLRPMLTFQPSVGILDETAHLYVAWDLTAQRTDSGEDERIEVVRWPVGDLEGALEQVSDAKTIIALQWAMIHGLPGV